MKVRNTRYEGSVIVTEWADKVVSRYDTSLYPPEIVAQCTRHGADQKIHDVHSGVFTKTGSVAACRELSDGVHANLIAGVWNVGRESFGWGARALAALAKMDETDAKATVDSWSEEETKEFAKLPEVKLWKAEDDVRRAKESAKTAKGGLSAFLKKAK